jgi:glycosyltransferase involved in cell wall biosynthesis
VLFASRLLRSKGLDVFMEAARKLSPRSGAEFLVAGIADDNDPDAVDPEEVRANPSVKFLGEIKDMAGLLQSVDVVCLPTRYGEGVPRILIEAAACGLPTIAAQSEGCRPVVKDGESGTLVPIGPLDEMSSALAAAIASYVQDPGLRERQGRAARVVFDEGGFSQNAVIACFVNLLTAGDPHSSSRSAPASPAGPASRDANLSGS